MVAARGIPADRTHAWGVAAEHAAVVVFFLAAYNSECTAAITPAGGIPPLIALLVSPSPVVQVNAAGAVFIPSCNDEKGVTIASCVSLRCSRRHRSSRNNNMLRAHLQI